MSNESETSRGELAPADGSQRGRSSLRNKRQLNEGDCQTARLLRLSLASQQRGREQFYLSAIATKARFLPARRGIG